MKEYLIKALTEPPRGWDNKLWKYGFLAVVVALFARCVYRFTTMSPPYSNSRYAELIMVSILLMNHLAFSFWWPKTIMAVMRILA